MSKADNARKIVELMSDDQIIDIIKNTEKFKHLVFNNSAAAEAITERYNKIISVKEHVSLSHKKDRDEYER